MTPSPEFLELIQYHEIRATGYAKRAERYPANRWFALQSVIHRQWVNELMKILNGKVT